MLCLVAQLCLTLCSPMGCQTPLSMGILQARIWSGLPCPLCNSGIKPRSPALQADFLPSEPPGKPKNTEVGSLSLLQGIFPTQESNWGLLHCRQILYQLSYQGSPNCWLPTINSKFQVMSWHSGIHFLNKSFSPHL